jgi:hypothetical protein
MIFHGNLYIVSTSDSRRHSRIGVKKLISYISLSKYSAAIFEEMDKIMGSYSQRVSLIRVSSVVCLFKKMFLVVCLCL